MQKRNTTGCDDLVSSLTCAQSKTVQRQYIYFIRFIDFYKNMLVVNLTTATHFRHVVREAKKDWQNCVILQKDLFGTFYK